MRFIGNNVPNQGRIQKIQKEGAEETDDTVLHHSGSIFDQTLGLTLLKNFLKIQEKRGAAGSSALNPPLLICKRTLKLKDSGSRSKWTPS